MYRLEQMVRRLLFSGSIAILFTASFNLRAEHSSVLAPITLVVTAVLFLLSWRLQKELTMLFIKEVEHDSSMWGDFERKYPRLSAFVWQWFITFASILCIALALDFIQLIEVNGNRFKWFIFAFLTSFIFRLFDDRAFRK